MSSGPRSKIGRAINPRKVVSPNFGKDVVQKETPGEKTRMSEKLEEVAGMLLEEFTKVKDIISMQQDQIVLVVQKVDSIDTKLTLMEKRLSGKFSSEVSTVSKEINTLKKMLEDMQPKEEANVQEKKKWF